MTEEQENINQHGQPGPTDRQRRTKRVECRVTQAEHEAIKSAALAGGFPSLAQYVREHAVHAGESPTVVHSALIACQAELNKVAGQLQEVRFQMRPGEPLDEEAFMVLLQIQDSARENLRAIAAKAGA